ncbi:hypothetical protein DFH09DRAFT_1073030 [Mycena vulgaris]|nr:hypothetical protein DFH09DRAFT_1073030 [Mycena vulgaris]
MSYPNTCFGSRQQGNKDVAYFGMQPTLTAGSCPFVCPNYPLWQQAKGCGLLLDAICFGSRQQPIFLSLYPALAAGNRDLASALPRMLPKLFIYTLTDSGPQPSLEYCCTTDCTSNKNQCATLIYFGHPVSEEMILAMLTDLQLFGYVMNSIKHCQPKSLSEYSWHRVDVQAKTLRHSCGQVRKKEQEERMGDRKSATQFGIMGCAWCSIRGASEFLQWHHSLSPKFAREIGSDKATKEQVLTLSLMVVAKPATPQGNSYRAETTLIQLLKLGMGSIMWYLFSIWLISHSDLRLSQAYAWDIG